MSEFSLLFDMEYLTVTGSMPRLWLDFGWWSCLEASPKQEVGTCQKPLAWSFAGCETKASTSCLQAVL